MAHLEKRGEPRIWLQARRGAGRLTEAPKLVRSDCRVVRGEVFPPNSCSPLPGRSPGFLLCRTSANPPTVGGSPLNSLQGSNSASPADFASRLPRFELGFRIPRRAAHCSPKPALSPCYPGDRAENRAENGGNFLKELPNRRNSLPISTVFLPPHLQGNPRCPLDHPHLDRRANPSVCH